MPHPRDLVLGSWAASAAGTGLARPRPRSSNRHVHARVTRVPPTRDRDKRKPARTASAPPLEAVATSKGLGIGVWLSVHRLHRPGEAKPLVAHPPTSRAPTTGCSCSDHAGYDESPSPEHEISRRRTGRKGSVAWIPPRCFLSARPSQDKRAHLTPRGGEGGQEATPP